MTPISRRVALGALLGSAACLAAAPAPLLKVYKTPSCGCCTAWVERMKMAGFNRVEIVHLEDTGPIRRRHGVPDAYASCHTGVIAGYALEGHVPPADVRTLLRTRPRAAGLSVPGMPRGSPGMEAGGRREAFRTFLIGKDGKASVFAAHG